METPDTFDKHTQRTYLRHDKLDPSLIGAHVPGAVLQVTTNLGCSMVVFEYVHESALRGLDRSNEIGLCF